jgi:hypothetical protein
MFKTKSLVTLAMVAFAAGLAMVASTAKAAGEILHDTLFKHMAGCGLVLGMAELSTITRSSAAIALGRKTDPTAQNRVRVAVLETAAAYTAASGDTFATGLVLPKGSRLLCPVTISNATNTASLTLAVGLRDAVTKVAIDATAIAAATAITTAATAQVNTGTKLTAGQTYTLPQDAEIYGTFAGATPTANAAIRVEVLYVAP